MKKPIICTLIFIAVVAVVYGTAAFIQWEWNAETWDAADRFLFVILAVLLGLAIIGAYLSYDED